MVSERVPEGLLVRFGPGGIARLFPAAFLVLWLCGWAFGECFAIAMLSKGVLALVNGTPFEEHSHVGVAFTIGAGAFLLFWLFLWTLGGLGAMAALLGLVWSEDRITVSSAGLKHSRVLGPFHFDREFQRGDVRQISTAARYGALVVDTAKGRFELSRNGSSGEREEAAATLQAELGLTATPATATPATVTPTAFGAAGAAPTTFQVAPAAIESAPDHPPTGWQELITPEGERALVPDLKIRQRQTGLVAVLAIVVTLAAFLAVSQVGTRGLQALPGAIIATLFALLLTAGAVWLLKGRMEWRIGSGRITLRRRFGSSVKDEFEAVRLEVLVEQDSDSDDWYALYACNREPDPAPYVGVQRLSTIAKNRRRIAKALRDPLMPRQLGAWLARAANVPLLDKSTPEARSFDLKALEEQLAQSGPLGRFAARFISQANSNRRKSA
ncbi:MAG: hypothetical protein ACRENN_07170 [Candidatus Eiseniibacteriota bacterium]